jgi:hypothetical protein
LSRNSGAGRARPVVEFADRARVREACTAGIYALRERAGWQAVGGGVCFRLAGRAFVVSSGRVLAPDGEPLWLGGKTAIVPLAGAAILADGPGAPPEIATMDVAFGLLRREDAEALTGDLDFLSLADVDVAEGAGDDSYYVVGPRPLDDGPRVAAPVPQGPLRLRPASSSDYRRCGVTTATHVILRPTGGDGTGGVERGASLRGCGVWRSSAAVPRDPLAGIVSDIEAEAHGCLIATRPCFAILGIMGFLTAGLPELSSLRSRN